MYIHLLSWAFMRSQSSLVSEDSRDFSVKKGILVPLPSRVRGNIKQYNVFEVLRYSSFDINLGFVAYGHSRGVIGVAANCHGMLTTSILYW